MGVIMWNVFILTTQNITAFMKTEKESQVIFLSRCSLQNFLDLYRIYLRSAQWWNDFKIELSRLFNNQSQIIYTFLYELLSLSWQVWLKGDNLLFELDILNLSQWEGDWIKILGHNDDLKLWIPKVVEKMVYQCFNVP